MHILTPKDKLFVNKKEKNVILKKNNKYGKIERYFNTNKYLKEENMAECFYESETKYEVLEEGKCGRRIKAHGGKIMGVEVYFENGYISTAHSHVHEQMTYCLEGEFVFYIGESKCVTIKAGDSIFFPSQEVHYCKVLSEKGRLLDVFTPQREDFLK